MFDIAGLLSIFEKITKGGKSLYQLYRENPAPYLKGSLKSGLEVAYRIIALFEAHGVKRTQIYQLLDMQFPGVTPGIDAENLKNCLSGELIKAVSALFAVRQAWLEGEDGPIYNPLFHYKDFPEFVHFVGELKTRNQEDHCFLYVFKSATKSDDLYMDCPLIALVFAEPLGEIGGRTILRYYPMYGPLPWRDSVPRYHLSAFFNVADNTPYFVVKGYSVPPGQIEGLCSGEVIPKMMKVKKTWHPEDFGYPQGYNIGRLSSEDWKAVLEYFRNTEAINALKTNFS